MNDSWLIIEDINMVHEEELYYETMNKILNCNNIDETQKIDDNLIKKDTIQMDKTDTISDEYNDTKNIIYPIYTDKWTNNSQQIDENNIKKMNIILNQETTISSYAFLPIVTIGICLICYNLIKK